MGRMYALSQVIGSQQQRMAALQQQLDQRQQEIEQLRGEVQQLSARENDLRAALDQATSASAAASAAAAGGRKPVAPRGNVAGRDAPTPQQAAGDAASPEATRSAAAAAAQSAALVSGLQSSLVQEQQLRQHAETELARLKEETSAPPFGSSAGADLAAARQEAADLRTALAEERATRQQLAEDFRALQQQAAATNAGAPPEDPAMQSRLRRLEAEKQSLTESFTRSLAESDKRAADLERQLAVAQAGAAATAGADDGNIGSVRDENAALRSRLDEEHRRTEEMAAKLKVASRVTDLIFKMQAQQAVPAQGR